MKKDYRWRHIKKYSSWKEPFPRHALKQFETNEECQAYTKSKKSRYYIGDDAYSKVERFIKAYVNKPYEVMLRNLHSKTKHLSFGWRGINDLVRAVLFERKASLLSVYNINNCKFLYVDGDGIIRYHERKRPEKVCI